MHFWKSYVCSNKLDVAKKQTAVSHTSTESEIISLDNGLRLDGFACSGMMESNFSVLGNISHVSDRSGNLIVMLRNIINLKNESM